LGDRIGPIDILMNNAGVSARAPVDEPQSCEVFHRVISLNLQVVFNVTHAFVEQLKTTRGSIISLSSNLAFVSGLSTATYTASKGASRPMALALAHALAAAGVRVIAMALSLMLSGIVKPHAASPAGTYWFMTREPMGRGGDPSQIVGPIVLLAP